MKIRFVIALCVALFTTTRLIAESITGGFIRNDSPIRGTLQLELASTNTQRAMGLMYRRELSQNSGMLFIYPNEAHRSFWMKNTYIPLDIIFLDSRMRVQGVISNALPRSTTPLGIPELKSQYVLELPAGRYQALGIQKGDVLVVNGELPQGEEGL